MEFLFIVLLITVGSVLVFLISGVRYVPNNRVGIVEKRFATKGSVKADTFIALNKEAGYQPNVLRGGLSWLMPIQYKVHLVPLVTIPQGRLATSLRGMAFRFHQHRRLPMSCQRARPFKMSKVSLRMAVSADRSAKFCAKAPTR